MVNPADDIYPIDIEICYVQGQEPMLLQRSVPIGTSIEDALKDQGFDVKACKGRVGIFGKQQPLDTVLKAGDRIEIYEPLLLDPKEARRLKALKDKKSNYGQVMGCSYLRRRD